MNGAVLLMDHPLKRDAWIEILKNVGYAEKILMEFPSLPRSSNPQLAHAFEHLQGAQQSLFQGEYREAVGRCRDVLEALSLGLGEADSTKPEVDVGGCSALQEVRIGSSLANLIPDFVHASHGRSSGVPLFLFPGAHRHSRPVPKAAANPGCGSRFQRWPRARR